MSRSNYRRCLIGCSVVLTVTAYWGLHSQWYATADGATRSLAVFHRGEMFLHGNNHLLFPIAHHAWHRAGQLIGIEPTSNESFLTFASGLNAIAGAAALLSFGCLAFLLTRNALLAVVSTILYGVSHAFLLHATLPSEPMLAVPLIWAAFFLVFPSDRKRAGIRLSVSAALAGLSIWFYEGYLVLMPGIALAVMCAAIYSHTGFRRGIAAAALWSFICCLTAILVFAISHKMVGDSIDPHFLFSRMMTLDGGDGGTGRWSTFSFPKAFSLFIYGGLNLFNVPDFHGLRNIFRRPFAVPSLAYLSASAAWLALFCSSIVLLIRQMKSADIRQRCTILALSMGACFSFVGPMLWIGAYDKLWIFPIGFSILLFAAGLPRCNAARAAPTRSGCAFLIGLAICAGARNLSVAINHHVSFDPQYLAAKVLNAEVSDKDLLVLEWDNVSKYFGVVDGRRCVATFSVPDEWIHSGGKPDAFRLALRRKLEAVLGRGGNVYAIIPLTPQGENSEILKTAPYSLPEMASVRSSALLIKKPEMLSFGVANTLGCIKNDQIRAILDDIDQ